ncbi:MAG: hypothetical protein F6K39_11795 [Okeania sp. SIO3B3]|nr:hypothetical protein [Okeania sp. SIO3B3]
MRLFQVYDADRNGAVEKDDFEAIFYNLVQARNLTQEMPQYQQLYAKFMEDWEYLQKDADQNADRVFELLDLDGNGVIGDGNGVISCSDNQL